MHIQEHVALAPFTTLGVGGPANYFCEIRSSDDAIEALRFCEEKNLPFFVLGGGSNILVSDNGFTGCVLLNRIGAGSTIGIMPSGDGLSVRVGAGMEWDAFVDFCVARGWTGLESLSGIPGTVGAAPVQNIGAYGASVGGSITAVEVIDVKTKGLTTLLHDECAFGYRSSIFKEHPGRYIIVAVVFRLHPGKRVSVPAYPDIQKALGKSWFGVTPRQVRDSVIAVRAVKGMVIMDGYECYKSAGSFFKNPIVEGSIFEKVRERVQSHPDGSCAHPWFWAQSDGRVKVAAACLLECAGFPKGCGVGSVGISPRHALSIINRGGARADDIYRFSQKIINEVRDHFGITLEREVQCVGF